ncbi:hypothetical protein TorRG33x02_014910 [Trema orientale]|uniref:Uncharacterized protein n=1 Tax=Trema orientale TaxID=63057 RepID=A0A2P5FXM5_TREOI|nr:hypothetical protein TorRG33x02_014910 [Trema orientale]
MAYSLGKLIPMLVMMAVAEWTFALFYFFKFFVCSNDPLSAEILRPRLWMMLGRFTNFMLAKFGIAKAGPATLLEAFKIFHELKRSLLRLPKIRW